MGQNANRGVTIFQSLAMGIDIYTISQSTHNQHLRTIGLQVCNKTTNQILSVSGDSTCTNDADDLGLIQIGITFIIKYDRCIAAFTESLRIVVICQCQGSDLVFFHEL